MSDSIGFSIIIPCYKICDCAGKLHDMYSRKSDASFEVIFVDDCSPDDSYSVLRDLFGDRNDVAVLQAPHNGGPGAARNIGLKNAAGKYVMFCDSDDEFDLASLDSISSQMTDNYDLAVSSYNVKNGANEKTVDLYGGYGDEVPPSYVAKNDGHPWGKVFKKSVIDDNNIVFPDRMTGEDKVFVVKYLACVNKVRKIEKPFYTYVNNKNSISHKNEGADIDLHTTFEILQNIYHDNFPEIETEMFVNEHLLTRAKQMVANKYKGKQIREWFSTENKRYPEWLKQINLSESSFYRKAIYKAMYKSSAAKIKFLMWVRKIFQ
ncbi:MAG: glycosyltransferase [Clostridiales bacterium]|nr:glycosyltransferase [Clostridiales bacterium]